MTDFFSGAVLKAERAKRHLSELQTAVREVIRNQYVEHLTRTDPNTGLFQVMFLVQRDVTGKLAVIIGDVIHNLRSALDHVAVTLSTTPIGTGNPDEVYFPTGKTLKTFNDARRAKMKGAPPEAHTLVEELEPYEGGKNAIRELHELDILDKHKLLVPSIARIHIDRLDVRFGNITKSLGATDFQPKDEVFVAAFDIPGASQHELKFDGEFKASFEIVFGNGRQLPGQDVVATLSRISSVVDNFIVKCRSRFPSNAFYHQSTTPVSD
jgi:hypothetical protein